jgi:hypothetical protein
MNDQVLLKIAGVFSILSVLANLAAFGVGSSRGLLPPTAMDFGSGDDLARLSAAHAAHVLPLALSLLSPCLAIPVGLGWLHVLKRAGAYAVCGVVMFYVGMIFVVLLDILELVLIVRLAPAYGLASEAAKPALLAFGATVELARDVLGYVGHFFGFGLGQFALGLAILKVRSVPRWLGWLSFVPAIVIGWVPVLLVLAGSAHTADSFVPVGALTFFVWLLSMAVILLRWRPEEGGVHVDGSTG